MSSENVEVVRRMNRAINRGDTGEVIRHTTEDVVMVVGRSAVEGAFAGHEGVRRWFADTAENFEVFEIHADEVRDIGGERVLSTGTVRLRGRGGGVETHTPFAGITTLRDGRVCRWEDFRERRLALAAAGLTDEPLPADNVALVRRVWELGSGDSDDWIERYLDPQIEWETRWPGLDRWFHGHDGVREWVRQVTAPMEQTVELLKIRELAPGCVFVELLAHGRGRASGVTAAMSIFDLYWIREGRIHRRRTFYSEQEALAAVTAP